MCCVVLCCAVVCCGVLWCVTARASVLCGRDLPTLPLYHWSRTALVGRVTQALLAVSDAPAPQPTRLQQLLSMDAAPHHALQLKPRTIAPTIVALWYGRSLTTFLPVLCRYLSVFSVL
jgi:hypothetical protein